MLDYASFPEQRQFLIKELLLKEGRVVCAQLAQRLNVSEHTIRRDLQELAGEGICKRVYGGAISILAESRNFMRRAQEDSDEKERLGRACAALIRRGNIIFIDAGSTNLAIAKAIPPNLSITVVTNSPSVALEIMAAETGEVIMLGGHIRNDSGGVLGITPLKQIEHMYFDQCFLGGCALDEAEGLTVFNYEDAEFKRAVVGQSSNVIVALTSEKLARVARYFVAPCEEITTLVIEKPASDQAVASFLSKEMDIHFAE
jgi:DeoR/GlpR family transcriptional regulator of sugar metabolism